MMFWVVASRMRVDLASSDPKHAEAACQAGARAVERQENSLVITSMPEDRLQILRAIERAERVLGPGRVRYVHPDCGFWMLKRSVADRKIEALVRGRDLFLGR